MGFSADLALGAAHHAGDGKRPGRVAYQDGEFIQAALDAVQGGQVLAGRAVRVMMVGGLPPARCRPARHNRRRAAARRSPA